MNAKENYLEAIRFGEPEYVPLADEPIWFSFQFEGNFRMADWTDAWGVRWEMGLADTVPFPKQNPLRDLDRLGDYEFPDADELALTDEARQGLRAVDRAEKLVCGQLTYLLFERAWALTGMDEFLIALAARPEDAHELLHGIAQFDRRLFERYLELGVDAVGFSEDLGTQKGLMMSPAMFREFFLPGYRYMFEPLLAEGLIINFHSCGCVQEIAADLAGIGVTVLNPVQSSANDLAQIKADTAGRMALAGAVSSGLLQQGTPGQVREEVARIMEIMKPGGGYVCGPDQWLPDFPEQNLRAMREAARKRGKY